MIKIIIPTTKTEKEYINSVPYKCLSKIYGINVQILPENKKGFCELYNICATDYDETDEFEYTVFMHDDLEIHDQFFVEKLINAHKQFDVVGLAGAASQDYTTNNPPAWHLCLQNQKDGRGFLSHSIPQNVGGFGFPYINSSYFGPTPAKAVFVDGVFISFKNQSLANKNVVFNETYTFHHYDMSACAEMIKKGLTIGVCPIFAIHHGLGEFHGDPLWHKLAEQFKKDYKDYKISIA